MIYPVIAFIHNCKKVTTRTCLQKHSSMASKTGDMLPSKRGAALARKTPVGDLSNSLKPSMNPSTRKQSSTVFSPLIEKEAVTSGIALDATKKKNTSKASLKQQPAGRKQSALSDISNSGKPQVNVASKRNDNTKLGVVAEVAEEFNVADEGFLHNHQECIKARLDSYSDMDTYELLEMISFNHAALKTPPASFRKEIDLDDNIFVPELIPELIPLAKWTSLPDSPEDDRDSLGDVEFEVYEFEPVEFVRAEF